MTSLLPKITLTGTISSGSPGLSPIVQRRDGDPEDVIIQANFSYGNLGASGNIVNAYVQTSLDGAETWTDVANFAFGNVTARKVANLSSLTPKTSIVTPTDGSLTPNTVVDGIVGPLWRVKYTSSQVYGNVVTPTTLQIDLATGRTSPSPNE